MKKICEHFKPEPKERSYEIIKSLEKMGINYDVIEVSPNNNQNRRCKTLLYKSEHPICIPKDKRIKRELKSLLNITRKNFAFTKPDVFQDLTGLLPDNLSPLVFATLNHKLNPEKLYIAEQLLNPNKYPEIYLIPNTNLVYLSLTQENFKKYLEIIGFNFNNIIPDKYLE